MNLLMSIITVVLNGSETIQRTINSVRNQSYANIEYIIIDGGSTDGTTDIVKQNADSVDVFVSEKDDGIYDAMNKGIRMAHGDVIGILNSDDYYELDAIEKVVDYFDKHEVEIVYGRQNEINSNGTIRETAIRPLDALWYLMAIPHQTMFVKRKTYEREGVYDSSYRIVADYDFALRLYCKGIKFGFINEVLANFSMSGLSRKRVSLMERETLMVSNNYFKYCDCKEEVLPILQDNKMWLDFEDLIEENPGLFEECIRKHMISPEQELIIFGIGRWGECCYHALQHSSLNIIYFWDNGRAGELFYNKPVILPERNSSHNRNVLLAVKAYSEELENQIKEFDNVNYINLHNIICEIFGQ